MSLGQKIIIVVGTFVITFITVCTFFKKDIIFLMTSRRIERKYGHTNENSYFIEDNFSYLDNYEGIEVHSKKEIINSIYYLINSGTNYSERYCAKEYIDCYKDIDAISNDTNLLSVLNNFVHPFNSFDSIVFNFDDKVIQIEINHTYNKEEIEKINSKVDEIIANNIDDNMGTKEKIKNIHDYIINHTEYDQLKTKNIKNNTYKSNTAYGVLLEGYGICSGYSDAMKIFLDRLNILNYKISNDQHIWNLVFLNGNWLHLDLTWDDPINDKNITRDNYLLIDNKTLSLLGDDVHYYDSNIFQEVSY